MVMIMAMLMVETSTSGDPTFLSAAKNVVVGGDCGKDNDNDWGDAEDDGRGPRLTGPAVLSAVSVCHRRLYRISGTDLAEAAWHAALRHPYL